MTDTAHLPVPNTVKSHEHMLTDTRDPATILLTCATLLTCAYKFEPHRPIRSGIYSEGLR
jgi:hypothetical protein